MTTENQNSTAAPKRKISPLAKIILSVVTLGIGGGIYYLVVLGPILDARAAMRWGRYDIALSALGNIPARFTDTPGVPAYRAKASLGLRMNGDNPDWKAIAEDVQALRAQHPDDVDVMVIDAKFQMRQPAFDKAAALAERAAKSDAKHAEAQYVLGLAREFTGDPAKAAEHYRNAAELAPDSLGYRSALGRALLETGKADEAIAEFAKLRDFPLARLDAAAALWSKGDMKQAAAAHRDAIGVLENVGLSGQHYVRREWMFRIPAGNGVVRLQKGEDKVCYAKLGEAASKTLAGDAGVAFPPAGCERAAQPVRDLLADRLCRYAEKPKPALGETAARLRRAIGAAERCPA